MCSSSSSSSSPSTTSRAGAATSGTPATCSTESPTRTSLILSSFIHSLFIDILSSFIHSLFIDILSSFSVYWQFVVESSSRLLLFMPSQCYFRDIFAPSLVIMMIQTETVNHAGVSQMLLYDYSTLRDHLSGYNFNYAGMGRVFFMCKYNPAVHLRVLETRKASNQHMKETMDRISAT
ncbi:uncharacterized protein [Triticum aestivum]|uniref:uncharacterized protein n=1 Tax=Triticum aestivum TaxID=4565 RepID=UPI001D02BA56|nr:uncharacterized protein LOC123081067 [Triticum aestivum]